MKPHGRDCPSKCSLCLGAAVQRVEQQGPELLIDGEPVREIAPPIEPNAHQPRKQRRGRK